ncbi:MAG: helix-turn-helix transcriptional regulator [Bdellovibrionaceae bacterium]|nr:helix-turn-helix transcriptional regulator [Pseudobdellovibrionaceae bacterium]
MKKHLTKVSIGKKEFQIPKKEAQAVLALVESIDSLSNTPSEVVFKEIAKNRPKGAVYLRGIRSREDISQKQLEKMTGIPLTNISKYESGTRKITDSVAKKFAKALGINAKRLLEE